MWAGCTCLHSFLQQQQPGRTGMQSWGECQKCGQRTFSETLSHGFPPPLSLISLQGLFVYWRGGSFTLSCSSRRGHSCPCWDGFAQSSFPLWALLATPFHPLQKSLKGHLTNSFILGGKTTAASGGKSPREGPAGGRAGTVDRAWCREQSHMHDLLLSDLGRVIEGF